MIRAWSDFNYWERMRECWPNLLFSFIFLSSTLTTVQGVVLLCVNIWFSFRPHWDFPAAVVFFQQSRLVCEGLVRCRISLQNSSSHDQLFEVWEQPIIQAEACVLLLDWNENLQYLCPGQCWTVCFKAIAIFALTLNGKTKQLFSVWSVRTCCVSGLCFISFTLELWG